MSERVTHSRLATSCAILLHLAGRVQIDYGPQGEHISNAVDRAFGSNIDYAMLVKLYRPQGGSAKTASIAPASAAERSSAQSACCGNPKAGDISTSYVERANLTMRRRCARFTRLTNAHSKKLEQHENALALWLCMHYSFVRIHQSLQVTPAAGGEGVPTRSFGKSLDDIVTLIEGRTTQEARPLQAKISPKFQTDPEPENVAV